MAAPVKLNAGLPDDRLNGLFDPATVNDFLSQPRNAVYVIAVVSSSKTETNHETGAVVPVLKIRHIEVVDDKHAGALAEIMQSRHEGRTGEMMLPFERNQDITPAHDPETEE
jgi:hypothetical protein